MHTAHHVCRACEVSKASMVHQSASPWENNSSRPLIILIGCTAEMRLFGSSALRLLRFKEFVPISFFEAISFRCLYARMATSIGSVDVESNSASSNASANQAVGVLAFVQFLPIARTVPFYSSWRHFMQFNALHVEPLPVFAL